MPRLKQPFSFYSESKVVGLLAGPFVTVLEPPRSGYSYSLSVLAI